MRNASLRTLVSKYKYMRFFAMRYCDNPVRVRVPEYVENNLYYTRQEFKRLH